MNVVSKRGLTELADGKRIDADTMEELQSWYRTARRATWMNLIDVRQDFSDADQLGSVLIFNVRHNRYRLIVTTEFSRGLMFIKTFLTHKEYDKKG